MDEGTGQTGTGGDKPLAERVKAILLKPRDEWPDIAGETASSGEIFTRYVMPLAAIGPLCAFLGGQLFGYGGFWFQYRPSFMGALSSAIGSYVAALIGVLVLTLIASKLAPRFDGEDDQRGAFKLVAYSMTAGWVAAAFQFVPSLAFLTILGLYSLYLFYTGAGPLLKVPKDKALPFTAITAVVTVVLAVIAGSVLGAVAGMVSAPFGLFGSTSPSAGEVTFKVPGSGAMTVDTGKIEKAANDIQTAVQDGAKAVPPADLQALLPETIGVYKRTAIESMRAGPAGSRAEGTYEAGNKRFRLSVADMSAIGAMAGLGAAFGVESNRQDADGYEHTTTKDGVLFTEKWRNSGRGTYGTMVGKRFFVEAEGEANNIGELKSAVATVDPARLAALAGS